MEQVAFNNISSSESMRRFVLGGALIGAVLVAPYAVPSWIALLACYPIFTAMIKWDPANSLLQRAFVKTQKHSQAGIYRQSHAV